MRKVIYAIGDIQGCYTEFTHLLKKIAFNPDKHQLWITGDMVNRGPDSLKTLRHIRDLHKDDAAICVLGNHDLHLLATAAGVRDHYASDTLKKILNAKDCDILCDWLKQQPLMHHNKKHNFIMVHAGISPQWNIKEAKKYAEEVEAILKSKDYVSLLSSMYGDQPSLWHQKLSGMNRYRYIINAFTRMRFCDTNTGELNFNDKGKPGIQSPHLNPWFTCKMRNHKARIVFGHWASLELSTEESKKHNVYHIDTGCVWGKQLTALQIKTLERIQVNSECAAV